MAQLARLVGAMTDAGYVFVTVSQLLAAPARSSAASPGGDGQAT